MPVRSELGAHVLAVLDISSARRNGAITRAVTDFWATSLGEATTKVILVVVIVLVAVGIRVAARSVIRLFVSRIVTGVKRRQHADDTQALLASPVTAARLVQRTRTLGSVLNNIVSVIVTVIALLLIVTTINPGITGAFSLITAALGAGLGFGAQNIVKDVLTGLFMVADDQLGVGDVVQTDLASGVVEAVGIRVTQIRDVNGVLWFVRNGEINRVGNLSQGWSRAIVDVQVPHDADVQAVQRRMLQVATTVAADPRWAAALIDPPELWGIESITESGVVVRLVQKTRISTRDDVAWALRTHLMEALESMGVQKAIIASAPVERYELAGPLRGARVAGSESSAARRTKAAAARTADRAASGAAPSGTASSGTAPSGTASSGTVDEAPDRSRE
ncbi:mechanosensitive ion channel family protein [uncultured Amnibacterium sp.]|uniref:mechanosensitive ion channel family protein n=1 Tax=uncultured Amnibacterium sp. TaxID=1631851 RepID=UPI0035CA7013